MKKQLILSVGVVLVMAMVMTSCCNDVLDTDTYSVKVIYDGEWSGNVGSKTGDTEADTWASKAVAGDGTETIEIGATLGMYHTLFASISKGNDTKTLTVQIIVNGEVMKESSTTELNGQVSIEYKKG